MKKLLLLAVASLITAGIYAAAATYTRQTARVIVFVVTPQYDAGGNITSVPVQASVTQRLINDLVPTDIRGNSEPIPINYDMIGAGIATGNVTAAGKTVTGTQLAALVRQQILDQANAAGVTQNGASKANAGALAETP